MSLLSRDELRVVLSRDQVQLVRLGREFTFKGWSYRVLDKRVLPCTEDADSQWLNAVKTLEAGLSGLPFKPAFAQVILSNYFMRYAMIPWSESLGSKAEEVAYAKHCFSQLYGTQLDSWELRVSQDFPGAPQFASAVDGELINSLRTLFANAKVKLRSVQPYLMTAYNNCSSAMQQKNAWFVLFEHGNLCLGFIRQGRWSSVRTIKVGSDWLDKLAETIDRESHLSEQDTSSDEIFLWAPEHRGTALSQRGKWKINRLQPIILPSLAREYDVQFAMAMCG